LSVALAFLLNMMLCGDKAREASDCGGPLQVG
jgi:hypothetical protein